MYVCMPFMKKVLEKRYRKKGVSKKGKMPLSSEAALKDIFYHLFGNAKSQFLIFQCLKFHHF